MAKKENVGGSQEKQTIMIRPINRTRTVITLAALPGSTLISHRLAPESVEKFVNREVGKTSKKILRNLDAEYEQCFHYTDKGEYGYPASGFMGALLQAAVASDIPKTVIKRAVRVVGDVLPLRCVEVRRRVDNPRRSGMNSAPDVRHRPEFVDWQVDVVIDFDSNQISAEQVVNLFNQAGFSGGVGDWRPSSPKNPGVHGMFVVAGMKAVR